MLEQIADAGPGRVYPLAERGAPPTIPRWRSLAVRRPDLMVDWDTDAQDNPDPYTIGEHSHGKVSVAVSQLRSPLAPVPQGPQPGTRMPGLR